MKRLIRMCVLSTAVVLLASAPSMAQRFGAPSLANSYAFAPEFFGGFGYPSFGYPSIGYPYYGYGFPTFSAPLSVLPNYWWVSPYPIADPRQDGYNPYAGYEWDSVGTLILSTFPLKAKVTLDGVFIGTANSLGPTQLPAGEHTLRVEAPGYEPYETVVKIARPGFQLLDVQLKRAGTSAKLVP